jgi:hypothetical protein
MVIFEENPEVPWVYDCDADVDPGESPKLEKTTSWGIAAPLPMSTKSPDAAVRLMYPTRKLARTK